MELKLVLDEEGLPVFQVVKARVKSTGEEYIRKQHHSGETFKWNGALEEWNEGITCEDARWIRE